MALDQGGQSSRARIFDDQGYPLGSGAVPVQVFHRHPGYVEQDPEEVLDSLRRALGIAVANCPDAQVHAAGLGTQRSSLVFWREGDGKALSPILSWQDRRAASLVDSYSQYAELIRERTGMCRIIGGSRGTSGGEAGIRSREAQALLWEPSRVHRFSKPARFARKPRS